MNKERRDMLSDVETTVDDAIGQIQDVVLDELDALYNLPDSLQDSDRGARMQEAVDDMEELVDKLEKVNEAIDAVVKKYTPAKKVKVQQPTAKIIKLYD